MHVDVLHHLQRLRLATTQRLPRSAVARWIEANTFINGRPFSFLNHEYQERILQEEWVEAVIRKSAQTGISEMSLRLAAALPQIMPGSFSIGYVLPSATFAASYAQTRFNPIIQSSPALRAAISKEDVDRADVKSFSGGTSVTKAVYFKGAATGNAAISTSLDMTIFDEVDFCDQEILGDYHSRLIHSPYRWNLKLSTPTFPGGPIDAAFERSRRHFNMCRCEHCGHLFIPDYYEHVRIPGWDKSLVEITAANLHLVRHTEARLHCPRCDGVPSLQPEHREWVCENPSEQHVAVGFQVSPFDAPNIVTLPSLIVASTKYASAAKFKQFSLGQPAADAEMGLTEQDIEAAAEDVEPPSEGTYVLGYDQGNTCHLMVGLVPHSGPMVVVHSERAPLSNFLERYRALCAQYRIRAAKVGDMQPNVSLSMQLAEADEHFYPAYYTTRQGLDIFAVQRKEEDTSGGQQALRQLAVNRNALFDRLLVDIRGGAIKFKRTSEWVTLKTQLTDMKRVNSTLRNGEFTSLWQKSSQGNDHYHHALGYLWLAAQLRHVAHANRFDPCMFGVRSFRWRTREAGAPSAR